MPKWKKDASEFEMRVVDDGKGSRYVRIPKPVDKMLSRPGSLKFLIEKKRIVVTAGEE